MAERSLIPLQGVDVGSIPAAGVVNPYGPVVGYQLFQVYLRDAGSNPAQSPPFALFKFWMALFLKLSLFCFLPSTFL